MAKQAIKKLSVEQVAEIFRELKKLEPPKRPTISEILEDNKAVIIAAINKGNSFRDISLFLTSKGLKTSHETLRKVAEAWGITSKRNKKVKEQKTEEKHEQEHESTAEA